MKPIVTAFHLPQFHRIPENDLWWGDGYTEWVKVKAAQPLFAGHKQPRVPLGGRYYDMLDVEAMAWQQNLARTHGIGAFCYYHYWFNGRELLEKPLDLLLSTPALDFPFFMAWANEPWTRTWDGDAGAKTVLMEQSYGGEAEWRQHILRLIPFFRDPRHLRIDQRPVFLIYRTASIAALEPMLACWRTELEAAGLPGIFLISMETGFPHDPREMFDARADFEPGRTLRDGLGSIGYLNVAKRKLRTVLSLAADAGLITPFVRRRVSYALQWEAILARETKPGHFLGAFPDWDNSPRRGFEAHLYNDVSPEKFRHYFSRQYARAVAAKHPLLFINAWNEWSEGAYLEPDEQDAHGYLESILSVVGDKAVRDL